MNTYATMTGAPITYTLGEKIYKFEPLKLIGLGELEQWARQKIVSVAIQASVGLSEDERRFVLRTALETAAQINFMSLGSKDPDDATARNMTTQIFNSVDGNLQVVLISLRQSHPREPVSVAQSLLAEHGKELVAQILRISGFELESADPK